MADGTTKAIKDVDVGDQVIATDPDTANNSPNRSPHSTPTKTRMWKDNKKRDRSNLGVRYALVVSIETPDQDIDIWTPVAQEIGIPITLNA